MSEKPADPQVVPYLLYADAGAAMDWLAETFGFTERNRVLGDDGRVAHGEMELDSGGVVMMGSPSPHFAGPAKLGGATQLQYVLVDDVEAHRARAQAAGAQVSDLQDKPYGVRSYWAADPEGHQWYFNQPIG